MAKAKLLPSGNWRVRVYHYTDENGKLHYQSITASTEHEANLKAMLFIEHKKAISSDTSNMTLAEAMDAYIEARSKILSPSSIRGYRKIQKLRFACLMQKKLNEIDERMIQTAVNLESAKLSPKTVSNAYGLLISIMHKYRKGFEPDVLLPQKKRYIPKKVTAADIKNLMKEMKNDSLSSALLLAAVLGLRRSELIALRWEDINFKLQLLTIQRAIVRDDREKLVVKDSTKTTQSTRVVHIPDFIIEELATIMPADATGYIFSVNPETILKHLKNCCERSGIPALRLHDLRHIMASVGLRLNIGDKYLMERGGWSSKDVMKNVYQHTLYEGANQAETLIENYFESLLK